MPISVEDVKLMASQRLADTDDGGGRMTGNEIVDGNVNNLFPDISRLDRVYGRVSLRKAFVSIQTADNDTYNGSHVTLSVPAADPNVNVCLFSTNDPNDERTAARNYIESYVVMGPRFPGWLWGNHPAGSRQLAIFAIKGTPSPRIGDVLYLTGGSGQYVRITAVEVTRSEFNSTSDSQYGATAMSFARDIFKVDIGEPLRENQTGVEITKNDSVATTVYTTVVRDAAKYYGVMLPTAAINAGDVAINVESIYTHLVPSAQGESPLVDLGVGEAGPVQGSGTPYTVTSASFAMTVGAQLHFGRGIKPGSLTVVHSTHTYTDDGGGLIFEGTAQRGTVDYGTGTLTFANVTNATATATATAIIGTALTRVCNSLITPISLANQGYNYTAIMEPLPVRNTVLVDYMSQGKWYRLRDNGNGTLVPDIEGTGTGTVNYATGSVILTCAALPDVDSAVLFAWGSPVEVVDIRQNVTIEVAEITHQLQNVPVRPGSVVITWPSGAGTATATDNGNGGITGAASGSINYATGALAFTPTALPQPGSVYTIDHDRYPKVVGTAGGGYAGGVLTINLPEAPVKPGSVSVGVTVTFQQGVTHNYTLRDNGGGGVSAPGFGGTISGELNAPIISGAPANLPAITVTLPGLTGTIDYVLGVIQCSLGSLQGTRIEQDYVRQYV